MELQLMHCYKQESVIGGGINSLIQSGGKLTIDRQCEFNQCSSWGGGGGIYADISGMNSLLLQEDGVKFEGCLSDGEGAGGGIYIDIHDQGKCIINKVQLNNCNAYFQGGGICVNGDDNMKQTLNGTQFTNCETEYQGGGMLANINSENSILELIGVIFENCTSIFTGGGLNVEVNLGASLLTSGTCLFKNCSTQILGGGCYVFCTDIGSIFSMTGELEFENCTSMISGGMQLSVSDQSTVDINQVSFKNCSAEYEGGLGVTISYEGVFSISGSASFDNCESNYNAGGFYLEFNGLYNNVQISGQLEFENCTSDIGGGMQFDIYNYTTVDINQIFVKNCLAGKQGGGQFVSIQDGGVFSICGSAFLNCDSQNGGGIFSDINDGTLNCIPPLIIEVQFSNSSSPVIENILPISVKNTQNPPPKI
ncbi:MAG: hypothetical protein EZS28_040578, partial [Streblomastix strix]